MTLAAWRLVESRHRAHAFDGEGARRFGGRWNSPGVPVVYVAESLALAALEVLVHLDSASPLTAYVAIPVRIPERLVRRVPRRRLPADWRSVVGPISLRVIGDDWVATRRSAVLAVPSAVIESECLFLLNPAHPEFGRIRIGRATRFAFDTRLSRVIIKS